MAGLDPSETVALSLGCLRSGGSPIWRWTAARWRARAAAAFHQAGVERHRRLFLSEMVADLEASGSAQDPAHATREYGLVDQVDERARERVGRYYETAIAFAPRFAEPLYNLAALRRDAGRRDEAFALFLRAAQAPPHKRAKPHAFVVANAYWEAASLAAAAERLDAAETLFRRALRLQDNFGPEHVRFPRLLQRLGKNEEALDHFERIMRYSHRYAAEFIEPDYADDERLPRSPDGVPFDPFVLTPVNNGKGRAFYFAHLYFGFPDGSETIDVAQLIQAAKHSRRLLPRSLLRSRQMRCSPTLAGLTRSD